MASTITELVKGNKDNTELTSIQVTIVLREKLKEMGKKGESYEDIINRCIEAYENSKRND